MPHRRRGNEPKPGGRCQPPNGPSHARAKLRHRRTLTRRQKHRVVEGARVKTKRNHNHGTTTTPPFPTATAVATAHPPSAPPEQLPPLPGPSAQDERAPRARLGIAYEPRRRPRLVSTRVRGCGGRRAGRACRRAAAPSSWRRRCRRTTRCRRRDGGRRRGCGLWGAPCTASRWCCSSAPSSSGSPPPQPPPTLTSIDNQRFDTSYMGLTARIWLI